MRSVLRRRLGREGAGCVHLDGNSVELEWRAEWVTASEFKATMIEPRAPNVLRMCQALMGGRHDCAWPLLSSGIDDATTKAKSVCSRPVSSEMAGAREN